MPARRGVGAQRRAVAAAGGSTAGASGAAIGLLLIDGRNVQHAMVRGSGPVPTASLIPRLRAAFSPPTEVELILDGHAGGSPQGRVAPGFAVAFTRGRSADEVILERAAEAARAAGPVGAWSIVVVSDDREVRDGSRRSGVRIEGTAWLADRMSGRGSTRAAQSLGHGRPPKTRGTPEG